MPDSAATLISRHITNGSKAHYALLMTPEHERRSAAALLSFDAQMRELTCISRDVAPVKLHWWHEEIERLGNDEPRHPIMRALPAALRPQLIEHINQRLHGAVVDFNAAQIDDNDLDRYLHMRSGALFAALAVAAGGSEQPTDKAAGVVCAISDLIREARDPGFANVPAAHLSGIAAVDKKTTSREETELAIEAVLGVRRNQALTVLGAKSTGSTTGTTLLALYKLDWPRIIAAPYGQQHKASPPWLRLWTAWRAAQKHAD